MEENYYQGPTRWLGLSSNLLSLLGFFLVGSFLGQFFGLLAVVALMEFPTQNIEAFQPKSWISFHILKNTKEPFMR